MPFCYHFKLESSLQSIITRHCTAQGGVAQGRGSLIPNHQGRLVRINKRLGRRCPRQTTRLETQCCLIPSYNICCIIYNMKFGRKSQPFWQMKKKIPSVWFIRSRLSMIRLLVTLNTSNSKRTVIFKQLHKIAPSTLLLRLLNF